MLDFSLILLDFSLILLDISLILLDISLILLDFSVILVMANLLDISQIFVRGITNFGRLLTKFVRPIIITEKVYLSIKEIEILVEYVAFRTPTITG